MLQASDKAGIIARNSRNMCGKKFVCVVCTAGVESKSKSKSKSNYRCEGLDWNNDLVASVTLSWWCRIF